MGVSKLVWNAAKNLTGTAPSPIANGLTDEWSAPTDLAADADNFTVAAVQVEFSITGTPTGTVNFYIEESAVAGLTAGGQNEPATLTRIGETSVNGSTLNYTTPMMNLNTIGGAWPPNFILKAQNQAGATITIVNSRYRTAYLDTT